MSILDKFRSTDSFQRSKLLASADDIRQTGLCLKNPHPNASGIILGRNPYSHNLMIANQGENVLLVAPCRSGKSAGVVVPTTFFWKDSLFVFDYKGELWSITAGYRKRYLHQKVLGFQPLCSADNSVSWNPLSEIRFQTKEERIDADVVADLLISGSYSLNDELAHAAKSALSKSILHLFHAHSSIPTLFDVSEFFLSSERALILDEMHLGASISYEVFHLIAKVLAIYRDPRMRRHTSKSDFSIYDLLDPEQKVSLYLIFGVEEAFMHFPIDRLLVSMIQRIVATSNAKRSEQPHLLLMLDDFIQLGYLPYCESSLSSNVIQTCLTADDFSQINNIYTKRNSIMSSCPLQVYFTPINKESIATISKKLCDAASTSHSSQMCRMPDEITHMSSKKELVFPRSFRPIYGDKIRYYLEPWFHEHILTPPPFH